MFMPLFVILIFQWLYKSGPVSDTTVTFPLTFKTKFSIIISWHTTKNITDEWAKWVRYPEVISVNNSNIKVPGLDLSRACYNFITIGV